MYNISEYIPKLKSVYVNVSPCFSLDSYYLLSWKVVIQRGNLLITKCCNFTTCPLNVFLYRGRTVDLDD